MWLEIAATRGEPVSTVKATYPEADFRAYAAYRSRWPSTEARLDFWFSQLLAVLANMFRKSGSRAVNPTDLIPDWWGDRPARGDQPKTVEDWKTLLIAMTKARGGKIIHTGKADG